MIVSSVETDERKLEYLLPLCDDLLELLIYVVSERYDAALSRVGEHERLEREVLHQLCIAPMAHSDLVKSIYSDNEKYTSELESVLARLAHFKTPASVQSSAKGVYELKLEQHARYSPYFYHYAKADRTKSEEHELAVRVKHGGGPAAGFFKPPALPELNALFAPLVHLLDSDVFVRVVLCVLRRFAAKSRLSNESQLVRALHLIALALYEEERDLNNSSRSSSAQSQPNKKFNFHFLQKAVVEAGAGSNLLKCLSDCVALTANHESHHLLAAWVLELAQQLHKRKDERSVVKQEAALKTEASGGGDQLETKASTSPPPPQASKDASSPTGSGGGVDKRKSQLAEKKRAKILAQLGLQQRNFIRANQELYNETRTAITPNSSSGSLIIGEQNGATSDIVTSPTSTTTTTTQSFKATERRDEATTADAAATTDEEEAAVTFKTELQQQQQQQAVVRCLGPHRTVALSRAAKQHKRCFHCILCQEDEEVSMTSKAAPMVLCCYVHSSRVLNRSRQLTAPAAATEATTSGGGAAVLFSFANFFKYTNIIFV